MHHDWRHAGIEPAIDDMLADPIVHAIMRRDRIGEGDVRAAIARARGARAAMVALPSRQAMRDSR